MEEILKEIKTLKELIALSNDFKWYYYLIIFGSLILSAIGAYIGTYLKKRAENLATKADIDTITEKVESIKMQYTIEIEKLKSDLTKNVELWKREQDLIKSYKGFQQPIFEEIPSVIVRIKEIIKNEFVSHFQRDIDFKNLQIKYLESDKKITTIYRIFRVFAVFQVYRIQTGILPYHKIDSGIKWYYDNRLIPVFTTGGLPDSSIFWRDSIREISELMVSYSDKWKIYKPISIFSFFELIKGDNIEGEFLRNYATQLATLIERPSVRLALIGIFLIDIFQDNTHSQPFEDIRNLLLKYLKANSGKYFIYGMSKDNKYDVEIIDIENDIIPRNYRSIFYDCVKNNCKYDFPKEFDKI